MKKFASHLSRTLVIAVIIVVGLCSLVMNWRFGVQLGSTPGDGLVIGVMSVAIDVIKWLVPVYAARAIGHRSHVRAGVTVLIWIVCVAWSMAAALGFSAINREAVAVNRTMASAALGRAQADYDQASRDLATLRSSPRWASTAGCTDATAKKSVDLCNRARELEERLARAASVLTSLKPREADPQAVLIARVTGMPVDRVRLGLAIVVAVVSELVSSLGFYAVSAPTPMPFERTSSRVRRRRPAPRRSRLEAKKKVCPACAQRSEVAIGEVRTTRH